jgi:hypothetical protein
LIGNFGGGESEKNRGKRRFVKREKQRISEGRTR